MGKVNGIAKPDLPKITYPEEEPCPNAYAIEIDTVKNQLTSIIKGMERFDRKSKEFAAVLDRTVQIEGFLDIFKQEIAEIKRIKVREFQENDVYEANKRIERLHREVATLQSNVNERESRQNFLTISLVIALLMIAVLIAVMVMGL
jgi:hypothetical protein